MGILDEISKIPILEEVIMQKKGRIINIISNKFYVEIQNKIYECTSKGIFKTKELKPVVRRFSVSRNR